MYCWWRCGAAIWWWWWNADEARRCDCLGEAALRRASSDGHATASSRGNSRLRCTTIRLVYSREISAGNSKAELGVNVY